MRERVSERASMKNCLFIYARVLQVLATAQAHALQSQHNIVLMIMLQLILLSETNRDDHVIESLPVLATRYTYDVMHYCDNECL